VYQLLTGVAYWKVTTTVPLIVLSVRSAHKTAFQIFESFGRALERKKMAHQDGSPTRIMNASYDIRIDILRHNLGGHAKWVLNITLRRAIGFSFPFRVLTAYGLEGALSVSVRTI
jgi:hypothetical protein